jgi:hypothetical protein
MKQVMYRSTILAKGSKALELYEQYRKTNDSKDRKKLDDHMKQVENTYNMLCGVSVQRLAR